MFAKVGVIGRGEIKNKNRYKQLITYRGMIRHRNITPTDIDTFIDYNGNAFIYADAKLKGKGLDFGQRMALENIANSHNKSGKHTIVFIYVHEMPPECEIVAADCIVTGIYWQGKWEWGEFGTLLSHVIKFEDWLKNKNVSI